MTCFYRCINNRIPITYMFILLFVTVFAIYLLLDSDKTAVVALMDVWFYLGLCTLVAVSSTFALIMFLIRDKKVSCFANMFLFAALLLTSCFQLFDTAYDILHDVAGYGLLIDALLLMVCLNESLRVFDYIQVLSVSKQLERSDK